MEIKPPKGWTIFRTINPTLMTFPFALIKLGTEAWVMASTANTINSKPYLAASRLYQGVALLSLELSISFLALYCMTNTKDINTYLTQHCWAENLIALRLLFDERYSFFNRIRRLNLKSEYGYSISFRREVLDGECAVPKTWSPCRWNSWAKASPISPFFAAGHRNWFWRH